ncbi:MAG: hypothetical protein P8J37_16530 [Fuerstiella sp.]|nr:hypothetical protein [Fuerstiella sp.]
MMTLKDRKYGTGIIRQELIHARDFAPDYQEMVTFCHDFCGKSSADKVAGRLKCYDTTR